MWRVLFIELELDDFATLMLAGLGFVLCLYVAVSP
jgi:hypothetical protein